MKKNIASIIVALLTILTSSLMIGFDLKPDGDLGENDIFFEEVIKPDGSGYIFDGDDGVNIPLEKSN